MSICNLLLHTPDYNSRLYFSKIISSLNDNWNLFAKQFNNVKKRLFYNSKHIFPNTEHSYSAWTLLQNWNMEANGGESKQNKIVLSAFTIHVVI